MHRCWHSFCFPALVLHRILIKLTTLTFNSYALTVLNNICRAADISLQQRLHELTKCTFKIDRRNSLIILLIFPIIMAIHELYSCYVCFCAFQSRIVSVEGLRPVSRCSINVNATQTLLSSSFPGHHYHHNAVSDDP